MHGFVTELIRQAAELCYRKTGNVYIKQLIGKDYKTGFHFTDLTSMLLNYSEFFLPAAGK